MADNPEVQSEELTNQQDESEETSKNAEAEIDVVNELTEEHELVLPSSGQLLLDASQVTPTKPSGPFQDDTPCTDPPERVFSSFPCQIIPETLGRMTRTPPEGEHLEVYRNQNGRLRIHVIDHFKKFSSYSNQTHKPCTVCNRIMKAGEMHLNFPADLDRRRIWANLLGFKYKDILRSKMGPVSYSIAAGPICTEHFAEECFRNHNFNKSAIEAFGVPVAISPDVKTTPSKKRVPWVCTICDFHSCSVVELQKHLLDHTEEMLKKKDSVLDVPEAGFMCPFCRKCTYGYKTITGYRRHLNAGPIHHCHLRRIYEFAKMNCRATELDPVESWDNWTRRNVYVAYHGCEPPANEIVLTPSPTKKAYTQNPEERTKLVHDEERRRKAVRSLSFVGKEGGTSVNDHNVMQRAVFLQLKREKEHQKIYPSTVEEPTEKNEKEVVEVEENDQEVIEVVKEVEIAQSQAPMGSSSSSKIDDATAPESSESSSSSSTKKDPTPPPPPTSSSSSVPRNKRKLASSEEPADQAPPTKQKEKSESERIRDEQFARMVQKRSQQVKRLINAKNMTEMTKPRKALAYSLVRGLRSGAKVEPKTEEASPTKPSSKSEEPAPQPSPKKAKIVKKPTEPVKKSVEPIKKVVEEVPKEPALKSVLARSFAAGVRPSMAKYQIDSLTSLEKRSVSSGVIATSSESPSTTSSGISGVGLFSRIASSVGEKGTGLSKRPSVLSRRPLILSPRKRASTPLQSSIVIHESSPLFQSSSPLTINDDFLIDPKDMEVEMVEEVIDSMPMTSSQSSEDVAGSSSSSSQPMLTLAEALELDGNSGVRDQELEEISKEMMKDSSSVFRVMEDVIKGRTVTKMRADMRLSRHCIRQIEAARARARLFGEGTEDYHIYYTSDGAQVLTKKDPKWKEIQQQQEYNQQPGASD